MEDFLYVRDSAADKIWSLVILKLHPNRIDRHEASQLKGAVHSGVGSDVSWRYVMPLNLLGVHPCTGLVRIHIKDNIVRNIFLNQLQLKKKNLKNLSG